MNIVLFTELELVQGLHASDQRVGHVRDVLSIRDGETFDAGVIDGMLGKAAFDLGVDGQVKVRFEPMDSSPPLYPVDVILGMSRPQTCRFVLRSLVTLGVRSIEFVLTEKGQRSYTTSLLWTSGEYLEIVRTATAQAFTTRLPSVRFDRTLPEVLASGGGDRNLKVSLDNYESTTSLAEATKAEPVGSSGSLPNLVEGSSCLLIGSERGWSDGERVEIRRHGFTLASMGSRVLRVETAAVAAVSTLLANRFWAHESGTRSTRR